MPKARTTTRIVASTLATLLLTVILTSCVMAPTRPSGDTGTSTTSKKSDHSATEAAVLAVSDAFTAVEVSSRLSGLSSSLYVNIVTSSPTLDAATLDRVLQATYNANQADVVGVEVTADYNEDTFVELGPVAEELKLGDILTKQTGNIWIQYTLLDKRYGT